MAPDSEDLDVQRHPGSRGPACTDAELPAADLGAFMSQLPQSTLLRDFVETDIPSGSDQPSLHAGSSPRRLRSSRGRLCRRLVRFILFAIGDIAAFGLPLGLSALYLGEGGAWGVEAHMLGTLAIGLLTVPLACGLLGLYGNRRPAPPEALRQRLLILAASMATAAGGLVAASGEPVYLAVAVLLFIVGFPLSLMIEQGVIRLLDRLSCWAAPAVLMGVTEETLRLAKRLQANPDNGLRLVGVIDHRPELWGRTIGGLAVLGPPATLAACMPRVEVAIVADEDPDALTGAFAEVLQERSVERLLVVDSMNVSQSLWTRSRDMGGALGVEFDMRAAVPADWRIKRILDCALAVPALVFFAPLIIALALWIKAVSPGPAFYSQERAGRNGRPIRVLKLRSMYCDAEERLQEHLLRDEKAREEWDRYCKLSRDPRILPVVGELIRKASLDELPQLWNVIRGDMSLVGPRPFPRYHLDKFDPEFVRLRGQVPPGLTGLWQVSSRSDGDLDVQKREDSAYIHNWSLWLDLHILIRTIPAVLFARGSR